MVSSIRHLWIAWAGMTVAALLLLACESPDPVLDVGRSRQVGRVLGQMHLVNQMVIQAASLAPARAESQEVRDYADRLEMDYSFADGQVRALAERFYIYLDAEVVQLQELMMQSQEASPSEGAGQPAEEGLQLQAMQDIKRKIEALEALQGAAFDRGFVQVMGNAHEMALQHLAHARAQTRLVPLEDLLSRAIPILEQHLTLAGILRNDALGEGTP